MNVPLDYEVLRLVWWAFLGLLLIGFAQLPDLVAQVRDVLVQAGDLGGIIFGGLLVAEKNHAAGNCGCQ